MALQRRKKILHMDAILIQLFKEDLLKNLIVKSNIYFWSQIYFTECKQR